MNLRRRTDWGPTLLAAAPRTPVLELSREMMGCPARRSAPGARLFAQLELANSLQLSGAPRLSQTHPPSGSLSVIVLGQPRQVRARQIH